MSVFEGKFPQWAYLIGYNVISALLWAFIFSRTAAVALGNGLSEVYLHPSVRITVLLTQSLAALDVLHAIIGTRKFSFYFEFPSLINPQASSTPLSLPALYKSLVEAQSSGSSSRTTNPLVSAHFTRPWFLRGAPQMPFDICTSPQGSSVATNTAT